MPVNAMLEQTSMTARLNRNRLRRTRGSVFPSLEPLTMIYIFSKILWAMLRPSVVPLLLSWVGLGLIWFRRPSWGNRLVVTGLVLYALILLFPLNTLALLPLEDRFPRPPEPSHVHGILVLSGAIEPRLSDDRGIVTLNEAAERMTEAVALALRHPRARVVFTGANSDITTGGPSEADWARPLLLSLGLAPERLTFEYTSRNTYENALNTWQIVRPQADEHWLLITSASHMPRAIGVFRRIGWNVEAWPAAYRSGHSFRNWIAPTMSERLGLLDAAVHEWFGLLAYRIMARTDALFPAPEKRSRHQSSGQQ
jgi:uncharacterized SAM-binding protein YcdF (DUF218 family)